MLIFRSTPSLPIHLPILVVRSGAVFGGKLRRRGRPERVLLDVPPQPRGVLDVARSTNAALFANLGYRLDNLDMRSLATAHLASGICGNVRNGRMFR
tara:strand:- start:4833 stop:5123 length:291 start_codon:yes stop_codon:yes gene_type:complete